MMSIIRKFTLRWGIFQLKWWGTFRLTLTFVELYSYWELAAKSKWFQEQFRLSKQRRMVVFS